MRLYGKRANPDPTLLAPRRAEPYFCRMLGTLLLASMVAMQQPDSAPVSIQTLLARADVIATHRQEPVHPPPGPRAHHGNPARVELDLSRDVQAHRGRTGFRGRHHRLDRAGAAVTGFAA